MRLWFWPKRSSRVATTVSGWWYNPNTNQAVAVPGNTTHHRYMESNPRQFLEQGETVQNNAVLNRWVQIRYYPSSRLMVIHFPEPVPPGYFEKTQDFLMGKVEQEQLEPKKMGIGSHSNLGALMEKSYGDFLYADTYRDFMNPRKTLARKISLTDDYRTLKT